MCAKELVQGPGQETVEKEDLGWVTDKRYQQRSLKSLSMVESCRETGLSAAPEARDGGSNKTLADPIKHSNLIVAALARCARPASIARASLRQGQCSHGHPQGDRQNPSSSAAGLMPVRICYAEKFALYRRSTVWSLAHNHRQGHTQEMSLPALSKQISKTAAGLRVKSIYSAILRSWWLAISAREMAERENWKSCENVGYPARQDRSRVRSDGKSRGPTVVAGKFLLALDLRR